MSDSAMPFSTHFVPETDTWTLDRYLVSRNINLPTGAHDTWPHEVGTHEGDVSIPVARGSTELTRSRIRVRRNNIYITP